MRKLIMWLIIFTSCFSERNPSGLVFFSKMEAGESHGKEDLKKAIINGDVNRVKEALKEGAIDYVDAMSEALAIENREMVGLIFNSKVGAYNQAFLDGILKNPKIVVDLMKEEGMDLSNLVMCQAARMGCVEMAKLMLEKGADGYSKAMADAAKGGHKEIVELMLKYGADDYCGSMCGAAFRGHKEIVELMLECGADDYNMAKAKAAHGGHVEIVKLMIEKGASDYSRI